MSSATIAEKPNKSWAKFPIPKELAAEIDEFCEKNPHKSGKERTRRDVMVAATEKYLAAQRRLSKRRKDSRA